MLVLVLQLQFAVLVRCYKFFEVYVMQKSVLSIDGSAGNDLGRQYLRSV